MKQPVLFGSGGNVGDWFQTIAVTAPAGSTITVSGGGETQTATGTGTYYAFAVHNQSTVYTITVSMDGVSSAAQTVTTGTTSGAISFVEVKFGTINVTLDNAFIGETITCVSGGTTISKTASGNSLVFRVPSTGTWTISGTISGQTYTATAVVSDLDTPVSTTLTTILTITATIHGAKNDTISFTDASGVSHTEVFATGQTSKSVSFDIDGAGSSIVFTSAVAKNPNSLASDYSKTVSVNSGTTDIYVMPDNALYWWGYESSNLEDVTAANGWTMGTYNVQTPTHSTNKITVSATGSNSFCGVGSKNSVNLTNYYMITDGVTKAGNEYGNIALIQTKDVSSSAINLKGAWLTNADMALATLSLDAADDAYTNIRALNNRATDVYALWYD